jgi:hypothetical protein
MIQVGLELEFNREPIAGVISTPGSPSRAFDGWLELAAALEDARGTPAPAVTSRSEQPDLFSTDTP